MREGGADHWASRVRLIEDRGFLLLSGTAGRLAALIRHDHSGDSNGDSMLGKLQRSCMIEGGSGACKGLQQGISAQACWGTRA